MAGHKEVLVAITILRCVICGGKYLARLEWEPLFDFCQPCIDEVWQTVYERQIAEAEWETDTGTEN